MDPEGFLNFNGKFYRNDKLMISPFNRSFRYGDGCFETMKMIRGKIVLENYHLQRLFTSLQALHFNKPNYFITDDFKDQVMEVARRNQHKQLARVRITISRSGGVGLYDNEDNDPNYLIQTWDLNNSNNRINEEGLALDIYAGAKKTADAFSHIKHNSCLCYAMTAIWARSQKLNDALITNAADRIVEATIGNVFLVKNGEISTPPLSEGCVAGVIREYLLRTLQAAGTPVHESSVTREDLAAAEEVFLTNSVYGLRWVKCIGKTEYGSQLAIALHEKHITPLFSFS
jgi:aminodeoxychorismate lyase